MFFPDVLMDFHYLVPVKSWKNMKAWSISQKRLCIKTLNNSGDEMENYIPNTGNKCLDGGTYSIPATFREKNTSQQSQWLVMSVSKEK